MKKATQDLYRAVLQFQQTLSQHVNDSRPTMADEAQDVVDHAYTCKKAAEVVDELRKQLNKEFNGCQTIAGVKFVKDENVDLNGAKCRGSLEIVETARFPKVGSDEEKAFYAALGIGWSKFTRLHWKTVNDWIAEQTAEGYDVPEGITIGKNPSFVLKVAKKPNVNIL